MLYSLMEESASADAWVGSNPGSIERTEGTLPLALYEIKNCIGEMTQWVKVTYTKLLEPIWWEGRTNKVVHKVAPPHLHSQLNKCKQTQTATTKTLPWR